MFDLTQFLPYLVNRAGTVMAREFGRALEPLGISVSEWRVLAALLARDDLRMSELADLTSIDRTTLSRLVGRMADADFVQRSRTGDDAREVRISLTDEGKLVGELILPLAAHYEAVSLQGLSEADATHLKAMLMTVYANLEKL